MRAQGYYWVRIKGKQSHRWLIGEYTPGREDIDRPWLFMGSAVWWNEDYVLEVGPYLGKEPLLPTTLPHQTSNTELAS